MLRLGVVFAFLLTTLTGTLPVGGAAAAPAARDTAVVSAAVEDGRWYSRSKRFRAVGSYWVADQGICVVPAFTGKVRYQFKQQHFRDDPHDYYSWRNPRLVDPTISVRFTNSCSSQFPTSPVKVADIKVSGRVYGTDRNRSCRLNPSLSFGLPWAISGSVTPECGSGTNVAGKVFGRAHPKKPILRYSDGTDGVAGGWNTNGSFDTFHDRGDYPVHCFRARFTVKTWTERKGKSVARQKGRPGYEFCINLHTLAR